MLGEKEGPLGESYLALGGTTHWVNHPSWDTRVGAPCPLPLGSLVLGSLLGGLFGVVVDSLVGSVVGILIGSPSSNHNHKRRLRRRGGASHPPLWL